MQRVIVVLLFCVSARVVAQTPCNCGENFEFVYSKIKLNYAGWKDKTSVNKEEFNRFTELQRQKAKQETQKNYCYKIIHDWLNYFRDHHTHIYSASSTNMDSKSNAEIRSHYAIEERISLTEAEAVETLAGARGVEGIWQMEGGNYRVAIVKNKTPNRDYAAVVIKADSVYWTPGQVKFELQEIDSTKFDALFYMRDHGLRLTTATLDQSQLLFEGLSSFRKMFPNPNGPEKEKSSEIISTQTEFRKLSKSTLYFRLPSFNHLVKHVVDSLIELNHDLITETPNLILDVRNNGGGSDVTYGELIQYLYTGKITLINNSIWSSPDNIQKFKNILSDPEYPESGKGYIRGLVKKLESNPNSFVKKEDNVIRRVRSLSEPKRVIVLMNKGCGSSCEEFVLAARQSKKVILMGENTAGVLDYANVHTLQLPCSGWTLQYATSRTNRLPEFPIDNIGIEPQVRIPEGKNWIEFATDYLNRNN